MNRLLEIGRAVRTRRTELGLSQNQLAHLSGLSRQTLVGLENGSLSDLGVNRVAQVTSVLGLEAAPFTMQGRGKKRGLWMAAKTSSVSYTHELAPKTLGETLVSGEVPPSFVPHLVHLLDEAPVPIVVMAVEEAAARAHVSPKTVWRNVARLAKSLSVHRQALWA
jgi:DNA-binding XRE family transcriptional regulator